MAKKKYYVVWNGVHPGIYDTWEACKLQVAGFENARYKSFETNEAARDAYEKGFVAFQQTVFKKQSVALTASSVIRPFISESLAVDAACSGNPGSMEYRGVYVATGQEIFKAGPYKQGTNNVGEFLALVHGLALLKKQGCRLPVYSDSVNAIKWVGQKKAGTKLIRTFQNEQIFDLIARAEKWLHEHSYTTRILKWDTAHWGEIPADFGRK
ncbi:MAG: ribonuclease H family protein [Tannerella sp.]|nr:ribonuclease H family protein [Tannerella sp.]